MSSGKTLLITGASSDVGLKLLDKIAGNYDRIWAHYCHSKEAIDMLGQSGVIFPVQADFSRADDTEKLIKTIAGSGESLDHIVHLSACKAFSQKFHKCSWQDYQDGMDTSLRSIVMILQNFLPAMAKRKQGRIVFMLSSSVVGIPPRGQSPYVVTKYALLGLMKTLSAEYAGKGITVNAVSPDMMETKFLEQIPDLIVEQNAKNNPMGRNIKIEEVLSAFEYFLSEETRAVTGQNIGITGGIR